MLAEGQRRAEGAGIANVDWHEADPATAALGGYDLLVSNFGVMFFGDPVAAFAHIRSAARLGARMVFVSWRPVAENPWMKVPMERSLRTSTCARTFAFADPECIAEVLTSAGWAPPRNDSPDLDLDIAAGPRAGGGCGSVDPNRRRQWLAARPTGGGRYSRHRVYSRGVHDTSGRRERTLARCDVVGQQHARLSKR